MAVRNWSKAKITLLIALPAFLVIGIPLVVWAYRTEAPGLSGDCLHVDQAMRQWMRVLPRIQGGLVNADDTALDSDTASAAAAIRGEAEAIQESALRSTVLKLADDLDRVRQGSPSSPPSGFPDRNYVGGMQDSISTGHVLKRACPGAVDDRLPEEVP
ncbi:hypothetical protein [Mycolicibacterium pulveris]|uniref:hypothetical protein n=1 Tax=Mycolicibacterium pulveris TaxID=36813 RepID=UPI003CE8E2DB